MARREILADDLDGKEGTDDKPVLTWQFGVGPRNDFKTYTVDLREENYAKLEAALAPFMENAVLMETPSRASQGITRRRATSGTPKVNDKGYSASDVREWAAKEGIEVSPRGRIHKDVLEKYEYAQGLDKSKD